MKPFKHARVKRVIINTKHAPQAIGPYNQVKILYFTLSVLRIFVHSVSCHFFLSKIVQLKFFYEITTFTSIFLSFDTNIFQHGLDYFFYDFKPNFLLEAGQILDSMDSNSLDKGRYFILNTPPRTLTP